MLKLHIKDTVVYLELISNSIYAFLSEQLTPTERIGKIWHALFIARIWRYNLKKKKVVLRDNFMTSNLYTCLEQNAHSLILIILFLKQANLSNLFIPFLFNSQTCENFYSKIRSLCSTYSMVATCSVKEAINRVSKIHLLNEISADKEFIYPNSSNRLFDLPNIKSVGYDLPGEEEILKKIYNSQKLALNTAIKFGLIDDAIESKRECCACPIGPYKPSVTVSCKRKSISNFKCNLSQKSLLRLKNYAYKFDGQTIDESSPYVEIPFCKNRFITKKCNLAALLRKETNKFNLFTNGFIFHFFI